MASRLLVGLEPGRAHGRVDPFDPHHDSQRLLVTMASNRGAVGRYAHQRRPLSFGCRTLMFGFRETARPTLSNVARDGRLHRGLSLKPGLEVVARLPWLLDDWVMLSLRTGG
jgi:hypothetical protein